MATLFVARSAGLGQWASDVGLSKHIFKLGLTEGAAKDVVAAGWAGFADWILLKKQDLPQGIEADEDAIIERLALREKMIDPKLYPKIKGTLGLFKVLPAHVENHMLVARALSDSKESGEIKLKPADFAAYLMHNALRGGEAS